MAAAAALLAISCAPDGASTSSQQPPKLVFTETTFASGHVEAGRQVTHAYAFRNAGGLDLSIDNVRAARACTIAPPSPRTIPPGAEGAIDVTFDTTHEIGHQAHTITVYSNDPAQPVTTLTLATDIDAAAAADPSQLYVGHLRRGESAFNSVRLITRDATTVAASVTTGTVLDPTLSNASAGATPRQLHVAIKRGAPLGRFKELVQVRTNSARQPVLTIPVVGFVDGDTPPSGRATEQP